MNAEDGACHCGRDLPAEKFFAQVVRIVHRDAHDWLTGALQRFNRLVLRRIGRRAQSQIDKQPVTAVDARLAERFAVNRNQSLALFARRLRNQLLQPGAKIVNARRRDNRHFVAAELLCRYSENGAE